MKSLLGAMLVMGLVVGCGKKSAPPTEPEPVVQEPAAEEPLPVDSEPAERPTMTAEECEAKGTVVGDIGDGRTQQPDFRCPNGELPIGNVPLGVEGSVCCGG